jgi:hypothetical protein
MGTRAHDDPGILPTNVELELGEQLAFRLPARGLTGHEWIGVWEGIAVAHAQFSREEPKAGATRSVGAERAVMLTLTGATPGRASLRIVRRRAWDTAGATDDATMLVAVRVR